MTEVEDKVSSVKPTYSFSHDGVTYPIPSKNKICKTPIFRHWTASIESLWYLKERKHLKERNDLNIHLGCWRDGNCQVVVQGSRVQTGSISLTEGKKQKSGSKEAGVTGIRVGTSQKSWLRNIHICNSGHRISCSYQKQDSKSDKKQILGVLAEWDSGDHIVLAEVVALPIQTEHLDFLRDFKKKKNLSLKVGLIWRAKKKKKTMLDKNWCRSFNNEISRLKKWIIWVSVQKYQVTITMRL